MIAITAWLIFILISITLYSFLKYWAIIPIASILLGIGLGYLANFRRPQKTNLLNNQFSSLTLLDLAAKHQLKLGKLTADDYQTLKSEIDKVYLTLCENLEMTPSLQQHLLESTWQMLDERVDGNLGKIPWFIRFFKLADLHKSEDKKPDRLPKPVRFDSVPETKEIPELPEIQPQPKKVAFPKIPVPKKPKQRDWHLLNILMPFIWQNIGWFIGGFCFVSGSIFLVSYTSGFYNALTIFLILNLYSLGLFWGAYKIRRHRNELVTSSSVLFTLGILLVPLNFTAALRLISSGMDNGFWLSIAILLSIFAVGIFFVATRIAAGVMERSLQNEYPRFFIALAALQFAKPLLTFVPNLLVLAGLHLILLAILGYALRRFTGHWLHSIFIDERKTAYYTAGTLVYAASVAFIFLTWNSGIDLPSGYAGFFLMAICLLLLSVDVQFKQWVKKQAFLSYFSFVIYALSAFAILLSFSGQILPPPSLSTVSLVLGMGAILYGLMVWQYLTIQPLYLFLASLSGLYWLFILQYFPLHWYFLLSLPGLGGIMLLHGFAEKRESAQLALVCCRVVMALGAVLLVSSLYSAPPGEMAMLTALVATIGILRNLYKPSRICKTDEKLKPFEPYKGYIATALATMTLAYMPLYFGIDFIHQFSLGLILLAILWATWGLLQRSKNTSFLITTDALFNSSLLSLILSITLAAIYTQEFLAWIVVAVSGVLLWLSLKLRIRFLFYVMLLTLGVGGSLLKHYYFPTSSGRGVILVALGIWLLLWWFHHRLVYLALISPKTKSTETLTILWFFTVRQKTSIIELLKLPLQQTMILLWLVGLWRIIEPVINNPENLNLYWGIAAFGEALLTALVAGYTRILALLPLAIFLFLGTLFAINPFGDEWFPLIAATFALLLWLITRYFLNFSLNNLLAFFDLQGNYGNKGGRIQTEQWIYRTAFVIIPLSVGAALFSQNEVLLSIIVIAAIFFWKSGLNYHLRVNTYLLIASICLGGFSFYALISNQSPLNFLASPELTTPLLILLAIGLAIIAELFATYPTWQKIYQRPLYHTAGIIYIWAVINSFLLFSNSYIWLAFISLGLELLPLLRPVKNAATIRSIGTGILFSFAFISFFEFTTTYAYLAYAFTLWAIANYGLPHLKNPWEISPYFWKHLGLLFIFSGLILDIVSYELLRWEILLIATIYFFLMSHWKWMQWLTALSLISSGLILITEIIFPPLSEKTLFLVMTSSILWANLLLLLSWVAKRYKKELSQPILVLSFLLLELLLAGISLFYIATWFMTDNIWEYFVILAVLLNLSFLYVLILAPQSLAAHSLLFTLFLTTLLLFLKMLGMPLLLNFWIIALLVFTEKNTNNKSITELKTATQYWLPRSIIASLLSLFLDIETSERLINLGILSGLSFWFGFKHTHEKIARIWMAIGVILLWVLLHLLWIVWQPEAELSSLLPWYALQNALLASLSMIFTFKNNKLNLLLTISKFLLTAIAAGIWLFYGIDFAITLNAGVKISYLFGNWDIVAIIFTGILLILLWWRNAITETFLIYGIAIIIGLLTVYIRLVWQGLAPLNVWDTASLMIAGYILFSFYHFAPSKPLYNLTLLLPMLAILTVPLQLDSIYATSTLIAAATLYLLISPSSQNKLPVYLGLLAINLGIYIWIPSWAANYKLMQIYTIPVAITVLIMLQFHQLELKPSVVNAIRLTALSAIYATATLDVFMRPELGIFILALGLSLGGIVLGIALRIRAFLYLGTLFLIFNVLGQLIDFYAENRLSKAIVLMVLGGIITGGMIWFNMQREVLMQRIRIIRADLARWE